MLSKANMSKLILRQKFNVTIYILELNYSAGNAFIKQNHSVSNTELVDLVILYCEIDELILLSACVVHYSSIFKREAR